MSVHRKHKKTNAIAQSWPINLHWRSISSLDVCLSTNHRGGIAEHQNTHVCPWIWIIMPRNYRVGSQGIIIRLLCCSLNTWVLGSIWNSCIISWIVELLVWMFVWPTTVSEMPAWLQVSDKLWMFRYMAKYESPSVIHGGTRLQSLLHCPAIRKDSFGGE